MEANKKTRNTLAEWYKSAFVLSSPYNISPKVPRAVVEFIYNTLLSHFGNKYFEINKTKDIPIDKYSWINALLSNKEHLGSIFALFEVSELIKYSNSLDIELKQELENLKRDPKLLRTFFFELFIYYHLDRLKIPNDKKLKIENQVLEGICNIDNLEYLFECRKVYFPNIEELDIMRRISEDFKIYAEKIGKCFGMICTINFKNKPTKNYRSHFGDIIRVFFNRLYELEFISKIDYFVEDEFGSFKVIDYNEIDLMEIKTQSKYAILLYIVPPKTVIPNQKNKYHFQGHINFSVFDSKVYKKLEDILKEKINQHRNSIYKNKIFFIDNEVFPEMLFNLFQNEIMYKIEEIKKIYVKLKMEETLCIVRRDYMNYPPKISVDVFMKEQNEVLHRTLTNLFK